MTELYRIRISAVFTANPKLDVGSRLAASFHGNLHQLAHALLIDRGKRIAFYDFQFGVVRQKRTAVVAAHAERGLSEIVGAETEELRLAGDLVRRQRASRHFDH